MYSCNWFLVLLIAIAQSSEDVTASCNRPDPPCYNCTSDPLLETVDSFPVNSYLTWTCNDGFIMQGDGESVVWVCAVSNKWVGDTPNCTEITCPGPSIPANGRIEDYSVLSTYKPGDSIEYSCDTSYTLMDTETSTCLQNGTWTNNEPFCKIDCTRNTIFYEGGNACFRVYSTFGSSKAWTDAGVNCDSTGGFLALVKDNDTQAFLKSELGSNNNLWIGGKEERHWKWTTNEFSIYRLFWNSGEPNNWNNNENCIEMIPDSENFKGWNDVSCGKQQGFICQYEKLSEELYSRPNSHQTIYRRNRYQFFDENYTWHDAKDKCKKENGSMIEVLDKSTRDFISNEASRNFGTEKRWWIGGYADLQASDRSWFWADDTRVLHFQWKDNEPNNVNEDCIEMWNSAERKWNDESCSSGRNYVCQFGLPSCGDPGEPLHGSRSPSDTTTFLDGATIDYYCDPGYEVIGSTSATCMLNGQWDSERPLCEAIKCPNNTLVVGNTTNVTISSHTYRGVATYTCAQGYIPDAPPVSFCQADGTWSYPNITCMALPPCYSEPCQNGATCTETDGVFSCHCTLGFTGEQCETAITTQPTVPPSSTFPPTDLASTSINFPSSGSTGFTTKDSATFVTSERTERISTTNHLFTSSFSETSTPPPDGDPQPQSNVAAAAGGAAAVFIIIILVSLALAVNRRRKRPNSKADGEMNMNHGMVLKPEENKYHDIMKPALGTGADNTAFIGDPTGYSDHGDVTGMASSSKGSKAVPFGNETEGVGADMMENALYEASDSSSVQEVHGGPPKVQFLGDSAKFLLRREVSSSKVGQEMASSKSIPPYTQVNKFRSQMVDNELYGETENDGRHMVSGTYGNGFKDTGNPQTDSNSAPKDGMIDNEVYVPSSNDAIYHELEENDQMVDNELYGETENDGRHMVSGTHGNGFKDTGNPQTDSNSAPNDGMIDNEVYAPSSNDAIYHELEENDQPEVIYEDDFREDGVNDGMIDNTLYSASDVIDHEGDQGGTVYENTEYHDVPENLVENELYTM